VERHRRSVLETFASFLLSVLLLSAFSFSKAEEKNNSEKYDPRKCTEAAELVKKGVKVADGSQNEQDFYEKAIGECPQLAEAHHNLAVVLTEKKDLEAAKKELEKAIALKDSADFRLGLAHIFLLQKDFKAAEAEYNIILEQSQDNEKALQGLSIIELESGSEKKSIEYLERALEKNPLDEVSLFNRAVLAERAQAKESAERYYKELLRLNPSHLAASVRMAFLLRQAGKISETKDVLKQAVKTNPENIQVLTLLASVSEEVGDVDDAEILYKKILAIKQDDEEILANLASLYIRKRQHQLALETLDLLFKTKKGMARGYTVQGIVFVQLGRFNDAKESLLKAIAEDPTQAVAHYNLGLVYQHNGEGELAKQEFERSQVLDPTIID
jgi:tetratricopeptide (TPR) repeat protein